MSHTRPVPSSIGSGFYPSVSTRKIRNTTGIQERCTENPYLWALQTLASFCQRLCVECEKQLPENRVQTIILAAMGTQSGKNISHKLPQQMSDLFCCRARPRSMTNSGTARSRPAEAFSAAAIIPSEHSKRIRLLICKNLVEGGGGVRKIGGLEVGKKHQKATSKKSQANFEPYSRKKRKQRT